MRGLVRALRQERTCPRGGVAARRARTVVEENGKLFVMTSPLAPDVQTAIDTADIKSRKPFNVSMMPPGLINALGKDELLDLLAYVLSAGNPKDKAFVK